MEITKNARSTPRPRYSFGLPRGLQVFQTPSVWSREEDDELAMVIQDLDPITKAKAEKHLLKKTFYKLPVTYCSTTKLCGWDTAGCIVKKLRHQKKMERRLLARRGKLLASVVLILYTAWISTPLSIVPFLCFVLCIFCNLMIRLKKFPGNKPKLMKIGLP